MVDEATTKGPKLRTKTGCITCRSRRKKCDEQYPVCGRCSFSGRECTWPTREALIDRRYGSRSTKTSPTPNISVSARGLVDVQRQPLVPPPTLNALSLESEAISQRQFLLEIEPVVAQYFVDIYFNLIINPESHPDFYKDWLDDLQAKMKSSKALRYAALANAASHISTADESDGMYELGISFYSRSIRGLSEALAANNRGQDQYAILMTVMLLYIHGQLDTGTYGDLTFHLRAATRIIKLKFLQDPNLILSRSFDRLAVESVMLQIFLLAAGPWSSTDKNGFEFDVKFWLDCEALLSRSTMYPGRSTSCNSPVLGIPISLFKLNLTTKRICEDLRLCNAETLAYIQQDVAHWEAAISLGQKHPTAPRSLCDDATFLYILIASLLAEQLKKYANDGENPPPHAASADDWQLREMLSILRRRHEDTVWHRTFITNWPVYSVGIFVDTETDKAFIREVMLRRWTQSSMYMAQRTMKDLETFWAKSEQSGTTTRAAFNPTRGRG